MLKLWQAKDIPDDAMLDAVEKNMRPIGSPTMDIASDFSGIPFKVVNAKLNQLRKRGFLDGCACGCRGDWTVIDNGF